MRSAVFCHVLDILSYFLSLLLMTEDFISYQTSSSYENNECSVINHESVQSLIVDQSVGPCVVKAH